ncbi:hypothetical protein J4E76_01015 [Fabibacter sp. E12]|nr:hypothetical protein [Roseivirga sp. E12]
MKSIMLSLSAIISIISLNQQKMSPEQIVQKQLETYNARDIEGFMTITADNVNQKG